MSYFKALGLKKEPFSTSPDPTFFYRSPHHRAALANLLVELRLKRGLSVILGDIGTGKTTLGRKLIHMLKERQGFLFHIILNPVYRTEEHFFQALVRRFGIELQSASPTMEDYCDALEQFLFKKGVEEHKTIVLIIDEAHKFSAPALEALRVLLNYETNQNKLLQVILLGQLELIPLLKKLPNFNDRISMKRILQPLKLEEVSELINFRLQEAGNYKREMFSDNAIREIYRHTQGYPRRIALLCHRALRLIFMNNRMRVDRDVIEELITQETETEWTQAETLQKSAY